LVRLRISLEKEKTHGGQLQIRIIHTERKRERPSTNTADFQAEVLCPDEDYAAAEKVVGRRKQPRPPDWLIQTVVRGSPN